MSKRYGMVCTSHEPALYAGDCQERSLEELRLVYDNREALLDLDDDLWPDDYRCELWWLRTHQSCRIAFEEEDDHGKGERFWPEDGPTTTPASPAAPDAQAAPADDLERRRGIAWLTDEDMMHLFGVPAAEGYRFRGLMTAPERFAGGVLVVHPDLDLIEPGGEAQWIPGAMGVATEYRVIDGEVWRRSRLTVEQLGGQVVTLTDGAGNAIADWRVPDGPPADSPTLSLPSSDTELTDRLHRCVGFALEQFRIEPITQSRIARAAAEAVVKWLRAYQSPPDGP